MGVDYTSTQLLYTMRTTWLCTETVVATQQGRTHLAWGWSRKASRRICHCLLSCPSQPIYGSNFHFLILCWAVSLATLPCGLVLRMLSANIITPMARLKGWPLLPVVLLREVQGPDIPGPACWNLSLKTG